MRRCSSLNRSILCDSSFLQVYLRIGRVYQHLFFPVYLEACGPLKFSLFFDMRHDPKEKTGQLARAGVHDEP